MRKLFLLFIMMAFAFVKVSAQVTFSPASFTAIDSVTVTVDVSGTPMAGETEAYLWIFSNQVPVAMPHCPIKMGM
jgi:hypothetical protein